MAEHGAEVRWSRGDEPFVDGRYSRRHAVRFDGGHEMPGSASPHIVRMPMSDPAAVDPEEAFVASLASCHMLWFLSVACERGWCVDRYVDAAVGTLARDAAGRLAMTVVRLRPHVVFCGERRPDAEEIARMHHEAHAQCFIANSVKTEVRCEQVE